MTKAHEKFNISEYALYAAILICTIMTGGTTWYTCIVPMVLLVIYVALNRKDTRTGYGALLPAVLLAAGFVSLVLTMGDKQNALYEYEKTACFAIAVFAGIAANKDKSILKGILLCAAATAVTGLLAYCNIVQAEEFIFFDRYFLRLQSFTKYANVTAVVLGCGYYAALALADEHPGKALSYVSSMVMIAMYLTLSKAAIPIFLVIGTVLCIIRKEYSHGFVLQNIVCMAFTVLIIFAGFRQLQTVKLLLIILCVISNVYVVHNKNLRRLLSHKLVLTIWIAGIALFLTAVCIIYALKSVNILATLTARLDYTGDALSLLREHWLTGIGPGAWRYYQHAVQTSQYNVTNIHNSWLQIWLENGIIYFAAFLLITSKAIYTFIKNKMYIQASILLFIALHSFADIDLGYGLILIISGLLAGSVFKSDDPLRYTKPVLWSTALLCVVLCGYMIGEYTIRSIFENAYLQENTEKAEKYALKLEKLCPYDSNLQISIASLTERDTRGRIDKAIQLSPLDISLREADIEHTISHKESEVTDKIKKYVQMSKYQEKAYINSKEYLKQALANGLCTQQEYDECYSFVENLRTSLGVTDRNSLLEKISGQN